MSKAPLFTPVLIVSCIIIIVSFGVRAALWYLHPSHSFVFFAIAKKMLLYFAAAHCSPVSAVHSLRSSKFKSSSAAAAVDFALHF